MLHTRNLAAGNESLIALLERSIDQVIRWIELHNYRAYDPGDGDLSYLRHLTFGVHFFRRLLTASVLRTPFHIRPLIGIKPHTSTKGMGYIGWGYTKMYALTKEERYRERARHCFDWLRDNRSPGYEHYCWGNHFAFSTRGGTMKRYTPTIVWSSLIGFAFCEAYDTFDEPEYLEVARSIAEWVKRLPRETTSTGVCLSYTPSPGSTIHNSNMLGAALLAEVGHRMGDRESIDLARQAMMFSCSRQNPDGSWYYGAASKYHWIDNFHTGYNLDTLKRYIDRTGDREFQETLERGFGYFKTTFFEPDGRPRYFHDRKYPTDIQCSSQAIDTLTLFSADTESFKLAKNVARWTITNMQADDGHFYYRDLGWKMIKTPMLHWGQGTMFKALAHLLTKIKTEL